MLVFGGEEGIKGGRGVCFGVMNVKREGEGKRGVKWEQVLRIKTEYGGRCYCGEVRGVSVYSGGGDGEVRRAIKG